MPLSRNAEPFLRRVGLAVEPESPSPELDLGALLVANLPPSALPTQAALEDAEGTPAPDRGSIRPWPYA